LRGIAFDLPGFGFAERPSAFDYTWTGLGVFAAGAVDALGVGDSKHTSPGRPSAATGTRCK
jgi:hypothetical protein